MVETSTVPARDLARDELISELRALRRVFVRKGVIHMTLFGSRARGDNRSDSDVDLAIDVDPSRKFSLIDLVGIAHVVEDRVGLSANMFMRRSLEPEFLDEIRRDGVEIF